MSPLTNKDIIVVVQCHIVKERCPGYLCEKAFSERTGGFSAIPSGKPVRFLPLTCGGCCGRALHRKLGLLLRSLKKKEGLDKERVLVQLASCVVKDNYHAPPCPHLDYLKSLIERLGLEWAESTVISKTAEQRRHNGVYEP